MAIVRSREAFVAQMMLNVKPTFLSPFLIFESGSTPAIGRADSTNSMNGKTIRILLGNLDRNLNSQIEASVRDACYGIADVEFTRMARLNDFVRQAGFAGFDLTIVAPDNLLVEPSRISPITPAEEVKRAIGNLKSRHSTPVFVVGVSEEEEASFLEAGAREVFRGFSDREALESAIRRVLHMTEKLDLEPTRLSFFSLWLRGLQRKSA